MRVLKLGLLSSIALVAIGAGFSAEVNGQDPRFIGGTGITIFEDRNFRGDTVTYQNNVSNLPSRFSNRISSVRVGNGEQWQVCDQPNFRGQCITISGEERDLGDNNWDNRISSMRRIRGGGGGDGGWNGNTNRPPSWMVGTFYSPSQRITLTIESGGRATANLNGESYVGGYVNGRLFINNNWSTVTRTGNGIRTYNQNTGATTDYSRGGGGGDGGWNGNTNRPPSWMVGTFYSSYPRITLTIESGGRATADLNGESYVGGYVNGRLFINNNWSTVTRTGNGIRTYNQNTGATTDYSRGGGGGGGGEGPTSEPPSWAIGTFYADNIDASMRITRDGRVIIDYEGQAYNGRYYAGQIYANNNVSAVSQTSAGFQTYNRNTGQRINYRRRR